MKTKIVSIFLLLAVLVINSCNRETISNTSDSGYSFEDGRLSNQLEDLEDIENDRMNDNLFMLAKAFTKIVEYQDLMAIVYAQAALSPRGEVKYSALISIDNRFKTIINAELTDHFCPVPLGTVPDPYKCIDDSMIYKGLDYYPNVYIPNIGIADQSKLPYVCVGQEINAADHILAFKIHGNGNVTETNIGEEQALESDEPIIIINNGTDQIDIEPDSTSFEEIQDPLPGPQGESRMYEWIGVQIFNGHRYEQKGASDVRFLLSIHDNTGNFFSGSGFNNSATGVRFENVAQVSGNSVSNSTFLNLVGSQWFTSPITVSQAYQHFHITTFEYDWYASLKLIQDCRISGTSPLDHNPRMKYSNEWYHKSICNVNHYNFLPAVNYVFAFGNYKSYFVVKRVL
ncbi:MAG: hypothetical protein AB1458_13505 [Bacteroidota bacterium]